MKKLIAVCFVMLLAEVAYGIADGPGGRLYITDAITVTADGVTSLYRRFWSLPIGTNWAAGTLELHGDLVDNSHQQTLASWYRHRDGWGGSPEILVSAPDPMTGYATFIMGLLPDDSPESASTAADARVMDILKVTPTAGSLSVTSLGGGRAWVASSGLNTDGGFFAMPDPVGQFTGSADYILASGMRGNTSVTNSSGLNLRYKILADSEGDQNYTDDDADYLQTDIKRVWSEEDMEIYGNRLFVSAGYAHYVTAQGFDGYFYIERDGSGNYGTDIKPWFCTNPKGAVPTTIDPYVTVGAIAASNGGTAVGWALDNAGVKHTAVWGSKAVSNEIWLFVDYNDDGDAMDNAFVAGQPVAEYRKIYDAASVGGSANDIGSLTDLELIETPNGRFLMALKAASNSLIILQLADNGEFLGTGKANATDYVTVITGLPSGDVQEIEFDWGQFAPEIIPEPATMLLVGTGVVGAIGVLRRRRMR